MMKRILLLVLAIIFSIIQGYSQVVTIHNEEKEPINLKPSESTERKCKNDILNAIKFAALIADPQLNELKGKDSIIASGTLDNTLITLKSGSFWDPREKPPKSSFLLLKLITKRDSIMAKLTVDYLEFVSRSESYGHLATDMIDNISFTKSFYLANGEKYLEMNVELRPDTSGKMKIDKRNVHFTNDGK